MTSCGEFTKPLRAKEQSESSTGRIYEDVLVPRVHEEITKQVAHERMRHIVAFEEMLAENDIVILKFFLHISKEEQTRRLESRLADAKKHWKISESDFAERPFWDAYWSAYQDAIGRTSKKFAPWFVIPADHKWYRNVAISKILVATLKGLKMKYPKPTFDPRKIVL
jgi:polyphosphate kinase 2 (PPK2 family)